MEEFLKNLSETEIWAIEIVGVYLAGIGAISASIVALWLARREKVRKILVVQSFGEQWLEHLDIRSLHLPHEFRVVNIGILPVEVIRISLSVALSPKEFLISQKHLATGSQMPIQVDAGISREIQFLDTETGTWFAHIVCNFYTGYPRWIVPLALRFCAWRLQLSTGETFKFRISQGLRDLTLEEQIKRRQKGDGR